MTFNAKRLAATFLCTTILGVIAALPLRAQDAAKPTPTAKAVLDAALKTADHSNKNVFVHFGASWCGWCRKLDAFLAAPEGVNFAGYVVVVELTVQESKGKEALENPGGQDLMNQWGGAKAGLPFFVFLDAKGGKIADSNGMPDGSNIGYPGNPKEVDAFGAVLIKAAPRMSTSERAAILDFIAKHP